MGTRRTVNHRWALAAALFIGAAAQRLLNGDTLGAVLTLCAAGGFAYLAVGGG